MTHVLTFTDVRFPERPRKRKLKLKIIILRLFGRTA